jgi:hypothetical protein
MATDRDALLTIAFAQLGARDWHGGQTLVTNAVQALRQTSPTGVRCLILGDTSAETVGYASATGADGVVAYTAPRRWSAQRAMSAALIRLRHHNLSLESALRSAGVQVVIGESVPWQLGSVATIGWLQDFQHRALPYLFSNAELRRRDASFQCTLQLADRLLATDCVAKDAREFAPEHAHKIRIARQYTVIDPAIYQRDPSAVSAKYRLPSRFFYVPNQFWVHKNHALLFEALRRLKQRGVEPNVVLTGRAEDYRDPNHFGRLMYRLNEWNLTTQVRYLGVVERTDVYDLIRQSVCVVNPSLFEGWGYAADEAAAIGKRLLVSDLPAHREQAPPACEYFDPADADVLANKLDRIWSEAQPGPDEQLEVEARRRAHERIRALGQGLFEVLNEVVVSKRARPAA